MCSLYSPNKLTTCSTYMSSLPKELQTFHHHCLSLAALKGTVQVVSLVMLRCRKRKGKRPSIALEGALCEFFLELHWPTRDLTSQDLIDFTSRFPLELRAKLLNKLAAYNVPRMERRMLWSSITWTRSPCFGTNGEIGDGPTMR